MQDGDWTNMSDRQWREQTGKLPPVEAAQAAVDRIAAGMSSLDEELERIGQSSEKVRAQVEAERSVAQRLGLSVPKPNHPDEFWWVRLDEGMPLEPACVSFEGDAPAKVQLIGDDSACGTPIEDYQWTHTDEEGVRTMHSRLELIERILPAGSADELRSATDTIVRQSEILTEVVHALRGAPPEGTLRSHHNAGELARQAVHAQKGKRA